MGRERRDARRRAGDGPALKVSGDPATVATADEVDLSVDWYNTKAKGTYMGVVTYHDGATAADDRLASTIVELVKTADSPMPEPPSQNQADRQDASAHQPAPRWAAAAPEAPTEPHLGPPEGADADPAPALKPPGRGPRHGGAQRARGSRAPLQPRGCGPRRGCCGSA